MSACIGDVFCVFGHSNKPLNTKQFDRNYESILMKLYDLQSQVVTADRKPAKAFAGGVHLNWSIKVIAARKKKRPKWLSVKSAQTPQCHDSVKETLAIFCALGNDQVILLEILWIWPPVRGTADSFDLAL